jgi:two-component system sensor histidine kinase RstB
MSSLFLRIYGALLVALLGIGVTAWFALNLVESRREARYQLKALSAPMRLIADGIARHQGAKRQDWLDIATRLFNAEISVQTKPESAVVAGSVLVDRLGGQLFSARIALPGDPSRFVQLKVAQWNEQQWRATLFLLLNEIGRHPVELQPIVLQRLAAELEFPLYQTQLSATALDQKQIARIRRGEVVMQVLEQGDRPTTQFFAPYGRKGNVLVLGPTPVFDAYPPAMMLAVMTLAALAFALVALALIRGLEGRLGKIEDAVAKIGPEALLIDQAQTLVGGDAIDRLAQTISVMTERIHRLLAAQREMVVGISHDLRTPVARINLRLELLHLEHAAQHEKAQGIKRDLAEIERLISEAITWSQLASTPITLMREHFDLQPEITQIVGDMQLSALHLQIEVEFSKGACWVNANRGHLRRLIQNLVANALRYARLRVRVRFFAELHSHILAIEDDGPGVPDALCEQIFEPFSRLDESRNKESGGYGLGLAIVRQIAQLHNGQASCTRSELGGAWFRVQWPQVDVQA